MHDIKSGSDFKQLTEKFYEIFDAEPTHGVKSPGRIEIIGNHTDHNGGKVIAATINEWNYAVYRKNPFNKIRFYSDLENKLKEVELSDLSLNPEMYHTSESIIKGIAAYFNREGIEIGGMDILIRTGVLPGSGISSSASFELLIADALQTLYAEHKLSPLQKALAGQFAENHYFGKPCGLMDQLIISMGGVKVIDFLSPEEPQVEEVDFQEFSGRFAILIGFLSTDHTELSVLYKNIATEMFALAEYFGKQTLGEVGETNFFKSLKNLRKKFPDSYIMKAIHFFNENRRIANLVELLSKNEINKVPQIIHQSGRSSCFLLNNCTIPDSSRDEVKIVIGLAEQFFDNTGIQGNSAIRIHGGGFGGTVLVVIEHGLKKEYLERMNELIPEVKWKEYNIIPDGTFSFALT